MPRKKQLTVSRLSTPAKSSIFGPAPVLESEDSKVDDELLERVSTVVKPADIFEDIWGHELIDLIWEVRRLQEYRTLALKAAVPEALVEIIAPLVDGPWKYGATRVYETDDVLKPTASMETVNDWVCGKPEGIEQVNNLLREGNLTMRNVGARAMILVLDKLEQLDDLIARKEVRRDELLRQIECRQASSAESRRAFLEADDADPEDTTTEPIMVQNGHEHEED